MNRTCEQAAREARKALAEELIAWCEGQLDRTASKPYWHAMNNLIRECRERALANTPEKAE